MSYVDGFVLVVPKKKLAIYKKIARKAGKIWREHGALDYRECVGDDLKVKLACRSPSYQDQARRDGGVLLDRLQIARASRQGQRQGDGRQAPEDG